MLHHRLAVAAAVLLWAGVASAQTPPEPEEVEVVVRGRTRPPASPRDPTAASTVLREEELRAPGSSSADVLARVPGVQVQRTGAQSDLSTASVRGATSAQTPVYLAGVRLNDDLTGTADLSTVPLFMLDRVEVFRGNAPEHADQLGLGGAIFLEPRLPRRSLVSGGLSIGSYGALGSWVSGAVVGERAAALVALRRDVADNDYPYRNDQGTVFIPGDDATVRRENADTAAHDVWSVGRYQLGRDARVVTILGAYDREQGVTGLAVIPAERSRAHVRRQLAAVSAEAPCSGATPSPQRCRIELRTSALRARVTIIDPWQELALQATRIDSLGRRVSHGVRVSYALSDEAEIGLGASQALEQLTVQHGARARIDAERDATRASVTTRLAVARPLLVLGMGAIEVQPTRGPVAASGASAVQPVGRVGAKLSALDWLAVLGNVGRYVRWPTLGELYGTSPLVLGNAGLAVEQGTTYDLGLRSMMPGELAAGYLEVFGFRRHVSELIAYQRTSFRQIRPYNVGSARVQGVEAALGATWLGWLSTRAALTLLDPRDTTAGRSLGNDILPYHSRLVATGEVTAESRGGWDALALSYAAVAVRLTHQSSRHQNPAGLGPIPNHTTADVEATAKFAEDRFALRTWVSNVLDASRFDVVGLPLPGRAVFGSLEASWW